MPRGPTIAVATATISSMVGFSQPILYRLLDLVSLVLGLLPSSLAVVAVILIGIESQKGGNQDRKNYDDCGSHRISVISIHCTIATARLPGGPAHIPNTALQSASLIEVKNV
jgi:type IV secretory pathway VirB2 component (pilin)